MVTQTGLSGRRKLSSLPVQITIKVRFRLCPPFIFIFNIFKLEHKIWNHPKVFLHCWAKVCFNIDGGASCDKIGSCGRRKKRAVGDIYMDNSEINEDLTPNGEVVLTVGPITVKDLQDLISPSVDVPRQEQEGITSLFLNPVIGTVTIVSLIIIMMVLVGLIFIIMRRRSNSQSIKQ